MVARIRTGKSLKGAVNYNEAKVKEGKATLIFANSYSKNPEVLNFSDKLNRLQKLADLNTRATTHCLHVSLNFDVSENLSNEKLQMIATDYMNGIGFGRQPYLVYRHDDAAHQHVHIVTTNIQRDGKRISMHNLGRVQSENARKEIEIKFGLVKAGELQNEVQPLKLISLEKVQYGRTETKKAISNIVTQVISQYKFASLAELNAVLKQYNVIADRGAKDTRMFRNKGLQYSLLDDKRNKIGRPVKASSIYGKPTLKLLESKYQNNKKQKQRCKEDLKTIITKVINSFADKNSFTENLKSKRIDVEFRINENKFMYGITYIDHNSKAVFNGSELGKAFSAAALKEKFLWKEEEKNPVEINSKYQQYDSSIQTENQTHHNSSVMEIIADSAHQSAYLPYGLKKKRKRKKRKLKL